MLKLKKIDQTNFLSFFSPPPPKKRSLSVVAILNQQNLENVTCTSPYRGEFDSKI